ncbi:MAG TPA: rhomboid family intramembrane serine protease [Candidatus Acidoferrales bacterium]|jgi:membrane associated rhomboid family serine protease|nr:rhomboid family intramembrane serine protease [Candidatus Acidoferrales bacterium]
MFDIGSYFPPAIKTICIACVSVFLLQELSALLFGEAGVRFWTFGLGLVPYAAVFGFRIWQPFTYIFLHGGILHILFNLLYLAMFGADLERAWGSRKFYTYFFVCGVGAGIVDIIVKLLLDPHGRGTALVPTIGASGAIYGVLLAVAMIMPHRQVWVFPLPVTVSMRVFVIVMGAIEFFSTLGVSGDNVSHVCHLGGMLVGYIYLRRGSYGYSVRNYFSDWKRRRLKRKFEVYVRDHQDKPPSNPDSWVN